MQVQRVVLAVLHALRAERDGLRDAVLDGRAGCLVVGELGGQVLVFGLYIVDDFHLQVLARGDDHDGAGSLKERAGYIGDTRSGVALALRLVIVGDDVGVQATLLLIGGIGTRSTLLAVLTTIVDSDGDTSLNLTRTVVVHPQGGVGVYVVQVEGSLQGKARERDAAHVDFRLVGKRIVGIVAVDKGIDIDRELRQGVLEGELQTLVVSGGLLRVGHHGTLHIEPGKSRLALVNLLHGAALHDSPVGVVANTPQQVDILARFEVGNVLDERVAGNGIAAHAGDAPLVVGAVGLHHLAGAGVHLYVGGIGEVAYLVVVIGIGIVAVLVGPVLDWLVCPVGAVPYHLLVVHEVREARLLVLVVVSVVGKHTEAASVSLRCLQFGIRHHIGLSGSSGGTLGVGLEADGSGLQ